MYCQGKEGKQVIVDLVQKIYNDEELPLDFVNDIFIPLPKSSKSVRCDRQLEFRAGRGTRDEICQL